MKKTKENIKEWITRRDLKDNIMRDMILRVDFNILDDITNFILKNKEDLLELFENNYSRTSENEIKVEFKPDIIELQKSLSLPIKELESLIVHNFKKQDESGNEITLLMTNYYICLNIKCIDYKGIESYVKIFSELISKFIANMAPVNLKRFGLRKIGYDFYDNFEDIIKDFEGKEFGLSLQKEFDVKNERMIQTLKTRDNKFNINYIKQIEDGEIIDEETKEIKPAYRVVIDIDGYFYFLEDRRWSTFANVSETIIELNNYLFILFIKAVTPDFLNKSLNFKLENEGEKDE